jgi:hypothetical protein
MLYAYPLVYFYENTATCDGVYLNVTMIDVNECRVVPEYALMEGTDFVQSQTTLLINSLSIIASKNLFSLLFLSPSDISAHPFL